MKIWMTEQEAFNLKLLLYCVKKGGVRPEGRHSWWSLHGFSESEWRAPISLDAVIAYAKGMKVYLSEISSRSAKVISDLTPLVAGEHAPRTNLPLRPQKVCASC